MNYQEKYEPEIDLKDLMFHILYRWRSIILAALIFCLLLIGYRVVRHEMTASENSIDSETILKTMKEYEILSEEFELNKYAYEQEILYYENRIKQQEIYIDKSVLMHTNPYEKPVVSADVFIKLENTEWDTMPDSINTDPTDSILQLYTSNFTADLDWKPIEELTGTDAIYLKELLSVSVNYSGNTFTITAVHSNAETAQQILDVVVEQIMDKKQNISENIGEHTLTVFRHTPTFIIDNDLANSQKKNADIITDSKLAILDYEKKIEELEEPQIPAELESAGESEKISRSSLIKYALVGLVLGAFMMICIYGITYIMGGRLHDEKELKDRYGYQLLGSLPPVERTGFLSGIDHIIEKLEKTHPRQEKEEIYRRIAINISNLVAEEKNIMLTGTVDKSLLQELATAINSRLKNINLTVSANMNQDTNTLASLAQCDAVILVEEKERSLIMEIQKEQESISALAKPVIGYILL